MQSLKVEDVQSAILPNASQLVHPAFQPGADAVAALAEAQADHIMLVNAAQENVRV